MTTSSQTSTGQRSLVTMQKVDGNPAPMVIHLNGADGVVYPNASGQITVYSEYVDSLIKAGWGYVIGGVTTGSGTTHAP